MKVKLIISGLCLLLAGCYPGGPEYVNELDVVYSNYSSDYDFGEYTTYSLPEGVLEIDPTIGSGSPGFIDDVYGDAILNTLRDNLADFGWTEVGEEEDPDVIMLASWASNTNYYYYDPGYWGGYYPGSSGWYYPGYYQPLVGSYTTGAILVQMTDPNGVNQENEVPVIWTASLNGLLEGTQAGIVSRLKNAVNQAFVQSDYLDKEN